MLFDNLHRSINNICLQISKQIYASIFISLMCLICVPLGAQSLISGKVTGKNGIPLSGASINIVDTQTGTISESDGSFSLSAKSGDFIECSYVGYSPFHFVVGDETEINIALSEAIVMLDEFVVSGYGTTTRKDVTGAITKVDNSDFVVGSIFDPLQQIQGKVAGVVIQQPGGDPNGEISIRIRGATSLEGQPPLLVIDGIAIDDFYKAMTSLNPSDIESFDILKDASAASIYGARGANGVILISTKKGKPGETTMEYQGFTTFERVANRLEFLDADQFRDAIAPLNLMGVDQGANTDWQKAVTQSGFVSSHTVALSSGSDQLNYRGSIGYRDQKGIILNNGRETINTRLNVNQKLLDNKLQISYGINTTWTNRDLLPDQSSTNQSRLGGSSILGSAISYLPVWPIYNSNGSYFEAPVFSTNPLYLLNENYSKQKEFYLQSSAKADYEILEGLKIGALGALTTSSDTYDAFNPTPPGTSNLSRATKSNTGKQNYTSDIHLNYRKRLDKHTIDFTGVYEYNRFVNDGFSVFAEGFLIPELLNNNLGTAFNFPSNAINSFKNEVRLISFLGRAVYNYDDRYIFTANFRRDGSSKFGPNNRWGNFPSFAIAWRASNESFLRDQSWLNLKIRMSYGFTGNQENLGPYQYQTLYEPAGRYLYNGQFFQSYGVTQESNPDLKWEVRKSFNLGLDFSMWSDRFYGTIDIFHDSSKDLIFSYGIPQPPFLTNQVIANAASATNKGVEVALGGIIVAKANFKWSTSLNIATVRNKITELLGTFKGVPLTLTNRSYGFAAAPSVAGDGPVTKLEVGYPAGVFYIPEFAGLDDSGNELFNNYNADGQLVGTSTTFSEQDRVYIDPTPDFNWGITNNFSYKDFELSLFFRGVQGQKNFSNTLLSLGSLNYLPSTNLTVSALTNGFAGNPFPSTYWLRDGSFARLENLTLAYQFRGLGNLENLRIYATGTNLFLITGYEGVDPEIRIEGAQRYIDGLYYPKTRAVTLGINLTF